MDRRQFLKFSSFLTTTAITGHLRYDFREECDCDYTPTNQKQFFI